MTLSQMPLTLCNMDTHTHTTTTTQQRETFLWCDSSLNLNPNILGASNPEKTPWLLSYLTHPDEREYTHTHAATHTTRNDTHPPPPSLAATDIRIQVVKLITYIQIWCWSMCPVCRFNPLCLWQRGSHTVHIHTQIHLGMLYWCLKVIFKYLCWGFFVCFFFVLEINDWIFVTFVASWLTDRFQADTESQ